MESYRPRKRCIPSRSLSDVLDEILASGKSATTEQWCYVEMYIRYQMTKFYHSYSRDDEEVLDRAIILMKVARTYAERGLGTHYAIQWYEWNSHLIETVFIARKMKMAVPNSVTLDDPVKEVAENITALTRLGHVFQVYLRYNPQTDMEWLKGWFATEPTHTGHVAQANFLRDVRELESALAGVKELEHAREQV